MSSSSLLGCFQSKNVPPRLRAPGLGTVQRKVSGERVRAGVGFSLSLLSLYPWDAAISEGPLFWGPLRFSVIPGSEEWGTRITARFQVTLTLETTFANRVTKNGGFQVSC